MIEKQVPGIKFDTDRKEQKTKVIHNKIPNYQNNWCKTKNSHAFTKSNKKNVTKRIQHFLGKQHEYEIISRATNPVDYITVKKLIETVKSCCFSVIDSDIEQCPWGLNCKHNKIFKELFIIFSVASKDIQIKEKKNFYELINARKYAF